MAIGVLTLQWDLKMPRGGQQNIEFQFKLADGITPFPITGRTFAYVARADPASGGTPELKVTATPTTVGQLVLDTNASSATLTLLAPATQNLTPGFYYHALWMDPGLSTAFDWFAGKLIIDPAPQP